MEVYAVVTAECLLHESLALSTPYKVPTLEHYFMTISKRGKENIMARAESNYFYQTLSIYVVGWFRSVGIAIRYCVIQGFI